MSASKVTEFRSLFLPLEANEHAVFSAIVPILSRPSSTDDSEAAAAAAGAYTPQNREAAQRESVSAAPVSGGPSALFATLSARADAALVVLRTREVIYYSLADSKRGPIVINRFLPTLTTTEAAVSTGGKRGVSSRAALAYSQVSCAALIPLSLSFVCRVRSSNGDVIYPRGVIGGKDGRVSVFSESSYLFGFAAHDCEIAYVAAVHTLPLDDGHKDSLLSGNGQTIKAPQSLRESTRQLGFITAGVDGTVFMWRRRGDSLKPSAITGGRSLNSYIACCVFQPAPLDWTVAPFAGNNNNNNNNNNSSNDEDVLGVADAGGSLVLPPSVFAYVPSAVLARELVVQELSLMAAPTMPTTEDMTSDEPISLPAPVAQQLAGGMWHRTTAIATDGDLVLVAINKEIYAVSPTLAADANHGASSPAEGAGQLVFKAKKKVTHLRIQDNLVIATCKWHGLVYILRLPSFTLVGQYTSYKERPLVSAELYTPANMMLLVDGTAGSVEMVRLPDFKPEQQQRRLSSSNSGKGGLAADAACAAQTDQGLYMGSVMALRYRCHLDDLIQQQQQEGAENDRGVVVREEQEALQESLHLARLSVPEECDEYMHKTTRVM